MKRLLLIVILLPACGYAWSPPPMTWVGQWKGEVYQTILFSQRGLGTQWDPERDEWPMTPVQAAAVARKELAKLVGDSSALMGVKEVSLNRDAPIVDHGASEWYFVVTFGSERHAAGALGDVMKDGLMVVRLTFIVFPDGRVLSPEKKKPNKAPEPTPRPVTIPAEPGIAPARVVAHL